MNTVPNWGLSTAEAMEGLNGAMRRYTLAVADTVAIFDQLADALEEHERQRRLWVRIRLAVAALLTAGALIVWLGEAAK